MSSTTTAFLATADTTTAIVTATATDEVEKAPRKFPAPCWTQEEAIVLIEAYRERWYALRRGYLRTADWDAVAATVTERCPGASPPKTSAQCRHKMEKLRQRYRAEKRRLDSYPYPDGRYYSTWFFFENMDAMENGTKPPISVHEVQDGSIDGSRFKSFVDQNISKLKPKDGTISPYLDNVTGSKRFGSSGNIPGQCSLETDLPNLGRKNQPLSNGKAKESGKIFRNVDLSGGYHQTVPIMNGSRPKKFDPDINRSTDWINSNFAAPGSRSSLKRGENAIADIVVSIKVLCEGFVKMEKAKMELAMEMEAMRTEMEMKRNEMILESQKQIVDVFVDGLLELKKRKKCRTDSGEQ